jgi:hypothetical protein
MSKADEARADLARQLLSRLDRLAAVLGDVSFTAELQLLKRDLARGHKALTSPADNDYRSVLTLVEAALASLTWKAYTPAILDVLRLALAAGARDGPFSFADYDAVRRHFAAAGIRRAPGVTEEE